MGPKRKEPWLKYARNSSVLHFCVFFFPPDMCYKLTFACNLMNLITWENLEFILFIIIFNFIFIMINLEIDFPNINNNFEYY